MVHATRTVGSIDVTAIVDADLELDPITESFPDIPPEPLVADDEAAASVRTMSGNWRLRVRAWLIRDRKSTSELQSPVHLVCRLLLEKKKARVEGRLRHQRQLDA